MKRRIGFTLVELLVVITIIALLAGIVLPSLGRAKELARRRVCLGNIRAIIDGMIAYASSDKNQHFPADSPTISGTSYIGMARDLQSNNPDRNPEAGEPGEITSNAGTSRSLFLLVRGDHVGLKAFICPSALKHEVNEDTDPDVHYDFASEKELSYSYQVQKQTLNGSDGWICSVLEEPELVLLADRNPISGIDFWQSQAPGTKASPTDDTENSKRGGTDEKLENSYNHRQEGQVVGYRSGKALWTRGPKAGMMDDEGERDNIWCWQDSSGDDRMNSGGVHTAYPWQYPRHEKQRDTFLWP